MTGNTSSAIAATIIIAVTGVIFYYMPAIMLASADVSPYLAIGIGAVFVLAFFGVFWLRARSKGDTGRD